MARVALEETDARIGEILAAIESAGAFGDCAFVITADHGMEDTNPEVRGEWSGPLRDAGVAHRDEGYGFIYLERG
jgi:phosphonoacetate hydrolase